MKNEAAHPLLNEDIARRTPLATAQGAQGYWLVTKSRSTPMHTVHAVYR
ncbi:hypothetical protein ACWGK5_30320 [Rhodococcus qingshengii]